MKLASVVSLPIFSYLASNIQQMRYYIRVGVSVPVMSGHFIVFIHFHMLRIIRFGFSAAVLSGLGSIAYVKEIVLIGLSS